MSGLHTEMYGDFIKQQIYCLTEMRNLMKTIIKNIGDFFKAIGNFFVRFGRSFAQGDIFVKLSAVIMGAGYFRRGQFIKGILLTVLEVVFVLGMVFAGAPYLEKFPTLGTVESKMVYNPITGKNEASDYDHSFKILLYSVVAIIIIVAFIFIYLQNIINVYKLQKLAEEGKHINTFAEDIKELKNDKFHIALLTLPSLGVILFTIVPLIVMVTIAFTNYDSSHLPPSKLFTWVGFKNFKNLFGTTATSSFGYSFGKILTWTLVWAFFATLTTYFGGIFLAKFINSPKTKLPKMWRTIFIITIAVPQFVTLLLVRNFFADSGIVNTICSSCGITDFLKDIGLVKANLTYIPFLSSPGWAKVMIILINIWIGVPYQMLIATGVLMNIPAELSESAKIDGANAVQSFIHITMPYMLFITGPALITQFVQNINNFNVIYLLTQDIYTTQDQRLAASSGKEVDLLVTWLFRLTSDKYNYKMAAVISIMVFIVCAIFTLLAFNRTIKGDREENFQ